MLLMEEMDITFFKNNFRCQDHVECGNGASCAIDVMLDMFYYSIFKRCTNVLNCQSGLTAKLIEACVEREYSKETPCLARHHVWDWLVENIPRAFEPKGRGDAEILEGLKYIALETKLFQMNKISVTCNNCLRMCLLDDKTVPVPLTIDTTVTQETHGFLPDSIEAALCQNRCTSCRSRNCDVKLSLPEVLMLEIGVVGNKNRQDPPLLIPEAFTFGTTRKYELVGAVLVRPEHFYCIVKHQDQFLVIDDLKDECPSYLCFSGALTNNHQVVQDHHLTSPNEDGIHVLLYHSKQTQSECENPVIIKPQVDTFCSNSSDLRESETRTISSDELWDIIDGKLTTKPTRQTCKKTPGKRWQRKVEEAESVVKISSDNQSKSGYMLVKESKSLKILGKEFSCESKNGKTFIDCKQFFAFTGFSKHISKEGFGHIDKKLKAAGLNVNEEFIFKNSRTRSFISLLAITHIVECKVSLTVDSNALLNDVLLQLSGNQKNANIEGLTFQDSIPTGSITLEHGKIRYKIFNHRKCNEIALLCSDAFSAIKLQKHVSKHGLKSIISKLEKAGFDGLNCFIRIGCLPSYITVSAFLALLDSKPSSLEKTRVKAALLDVFVKDMTSGVIMKKNMQSPVKLKFTSPVSVYSTPKKLKCKNKFKKKLAVKKEKTLSQRSQGSMKHYLKDICSREFNGDKKLLLQALASMIKPTRKKSDELECNSFDGTFNYQDILFLLKTAKGSSRYGEKQSFLQNLIYSEAVDIFKLSPAELVFMQQNYSGTRLFEELRHRLPGIIPSQRLERFAKKEFEKDFTAVLLPSRTSSGWQIDAGRLMEVLCLKYNQVDGPKHWKVYGDGREIGGRQSTFVAISLLNNEAFYHDCSFQSPKNIFPVNIFYESDSPQGPVQFYIMPYLRPPNC